MSVTTYVCKMVEKEKESTKAYILHLKVLMLQEGVGGWEVRC